MFIPIYKIHTDLCHEKEGIILSKEAENLHNQREWLLNALAMDAYNSSSNSLKSLVNFLFGEMVAKIGLKVKSPNRGKQALKTVLINLWLSNLLGMPVRYSRDKNAYSHNRKYGKLYFKYHTLLPVIDALLALEYIEEKKGRSFYENKKRGHQTRIWPAVLLIELFIDHQLITPNFIQKPEPEELIIKKDKNKKLVGYREDKNTKQMRTDLECYNEFAKKHYITVILKSKNLITNHFLINLFRDYITNRIGLKEVVYNNEDRNIKIPSQEILKLYTKGFRRESTIQIINDNIHNTDTTQTQPTITQEFSPKSAMDERLQRIYFYSKNRLIDFLVLLNRKLGRGKKNDESLTKPFFMKELGIEHLQFTLNQEYLYRVFNRNSFQTGGRAYGSLHQNLPKDMRPCIQINGEKTIELDYSAYHILMLYHMEGIDYQHDPHLECGGKKLRSIFKKVGLIAINAKNKKKAMGAIYKKLTGEEFLLLKVDKPLLWLIKKFEAAHKPILKYLFSGIGLTLQNTDSKIMNNILLNLMDKEILGLSVYDSVIVAEQHRDYLYGLMMDEYEKELGYKPKIG
ncbi:MAG: hypothetical protein J7K84_05885 [Deltaproteobacteria bacterium]|nr:hypothetical protein [Deltaproteobacteria bacterium]